MESYCKEHVQTFVQKMFSMYIDCSVFFYIRTKLINSGIFARYIRIKIKGEINMKQKTSYLNLSVVLNSFQANVPFQYAYKRQTTRGRA